jgi:hypothetical protein
VGGVTGVRSPHGNATLESNNFEYKDAFFQEMSIDFSLMAGVEERSYKL